MYGPNRPAVPIRAAVGPELVVECPTCGQPKGAACEARGGRDESTEVPHNRRYLAAKMDPYATPDAVA